MGYVIAAVLVLLIVSGFVLFLVTNATRKGNVSDADDPGAEQNALSILGSDDETPAGDTSQHAGEQTEEGTTVGGQDADAHGGTGAPPGRFKGARGGAADSPDVARPVIGGEAEGERSTR
jgi:hypothetical protein